MKNVNTRGRILILVALAALPTLAVTVYGSWDERVRAIAAARKDMQKLARLAAQQQEQVIEGARQTLVAVSLIPAAVRNNRAGCNDYLARLLKKSSGLYHSIGIYNTDGLLICDAIPWEGKIFSSDRMYYRLALATGRFSIGEYQIGRVTKLQSINFSLPISDASGAHAGVAFIALDLGILNNLASAVPLPEQGVLAVLDHKGIVLSRSPPLAETIGRKIPVPGILKAVLSARNGVFEARGTGDVERLIAYDTVAENADGKVALRIMVSVPLDVVLADANRALVRNLAGIMVATLLLLIAAWYGAEVFVLRSVRKLLSAAKRVEAGRLGARTGLVSGKDELSQVGSAFDRMASALQARDAQLQRALHELKEQAATDPLTGLSNRRFLYQALPRELMRAGRNAAPVAVIMLDIDHFKRINDTYGHDAGDCVLKEVARAVNAAIRPGDICCRYGGEEIVLVLPEMPLESAQVRAEAIRASIENLSVGGAGDGQLRVTVSLGVAACPAHGADTDALLRAADEALYEAKGAGRNRVAVYAKEPAAAAARSQ